MMKAIFSTKFRKDYKQMEKRNFNMHKLISVMALLEKEILLSPKYKKHPLEGTYKSCMECHIEPDWLLIYRIHSETKTLYFVRTGTHSDLFHS
ncbi:hypothetical protein FACS1894198_2310 [Clostridia bacterium]|nr:hypothetical protein FACS1894198_2310 [Clostridia bacterium]